jgi:repressor LexA
VKALSPKQLKILSFLRYFREERDYPPTIRDIQQGCGISSTSVVDYNLKVLEKEGYIRRDREVSRGIELLEKTHGRAVRVPILGFIAAGEPIPVPTSDNWESEALDVIEVGSETVHGGEEVYALRVRGNSMIDALVHDGDIVLMRKTATADDGEMVAAWLKKEEETTLKKLYRENESIRLQPANSQMSPIYVDPDNLAIQGRVIGIIRRLD